MSYNLERREGAIWVAIGSYASEHAAYEQLTSRSSIRRGMWRIVRKSPGRPEEVIVVIST